MKKSRKKTFFELMPQDDYWMGMAFWAATLSRSPKRHGAVIVSEGRPVILAGDTPPKSAPDADFYRPAERVAVNEFDNQPGACIYLTYTPEPEGLIEVFASDIRRVVYFPTSPIDRVCKEMASQFYCHLIEFTGNLNWMRDHLAALKSEGVFS